jgi:hypothetical protein
MKLLRKATAVVLAVMLFAGVFAGGAAAAPESGGISIQLNGKNIEFPSGVAPYFDKAAGRVFVPVRDLFAELGAEVEYDDETRVITLTRGGLTVVFPQDSTTISITAGGVTATIESDVKPITVDNRVLVPLRFVANALGSVVGWDQAAQTAIVVDPESYLAARAETFTILEKLLEAEGEQSQGNQAVSATVEGSVTTAGMNIPLSFKLDGVSSQTAADLKLAGTMTLPAEVAQTVPGLTAELAIAADMLYDAETGTYAIHSELLNTLAFGLSPDTWLVANMYEMLAQQGADVKSLLAQQNGASAAGVGTLINSVIAQQLLAMSEPTSVSDFEDEFKAVVDVMYALVGDSGFKETEDGYASEFSFSDGGDEVDASIKIKTDADGKAESVAAVVTMKTDGKTVFSEKANASADGSFEIAILIDAGDLAAEVTVKGEMKPTTEEPSAKIPEDAPTVDIASLASLPVGGVAAGVA